MAFSVSFGVVLSVWFSVGLKIATLVSAISISASADIDIVIDVSRAVEAVMAFINKDCFCILIGLL